MWTLINTKYGFLGRKLQNWLRITRVKEEDSLHNYLERYQSNEDLTNYILQKEVEHLWGPWGTAIEGIHLS